MIQTTYFPLLALLVSTGFAQEKPLQPKIDSVALFKNGLAVVSASFEPDGAGDYVWADPPKAIHGTFFVESAGGMVIRSSMRSLPEKGPASPTGLLQRDLAGATIRGSLTLGEEGGTQAFAGTVWEMPWPDHKEWLTSYASTDRNRNSWYGWHSWSPWRWGRWMGHQAQASPTVGDWLVIESEAGRRYLKQQSVREFTVLEEPPQRASVPTPVLVFSAKEAGKVRVTFLAKGLAWMPSYRVDLIDEQRMRILQNAVVRNEMMDFLDTEFFLISGYPDVRMGHVDSPLDATTSLAAFMSQITSQRGGSESGFVSQTVAIGSQSDVGGPMDLTEGSEGGPDLHYHPIGRFDLREGDSLSLMVDKKLAEYEPLVLWTVPDLHEYGNERRAKLEGSEGTTAWDAIEFANPFGFPMTTAPVTVMKEGRFLGQTETPWVAKGATGLVKTGRTGSVLVNYQDEHSSERRVQRVEATLEVSSARTDPVSMVVRAEIRGELKETSEEPLRRAKKGGQLSRGRRQHLEWRFPLDAGASKSIQFRFEKTHR